MKQQAFSTGVVYWPGRTAFDMWREFDAGEIAADFAHIAALGLDTIRFFVRWDLFAPEPGTVDPVMLDRLQRVLDCAYDAGLRAIPVLFSGHVLGVNYLPSWALDSRRSRGPYRTFTGDVESPYGAGDLYRGPLLEAQVAFARIAGTRLRDHPAIRAWDLGHAFDRVRELSARKLPTGEHSSEPVDERAVAEWSRRLASELRAASGLPATAGTDLGVLTHDREVRLGTLCLPFAFSSMQGESVRARFARGRLDPEAVPFLAALAAAFSHQPVFVTGFGNPTCPGDKFSAFERFSEPGDRQSLTIEDDDTAFATYPCLTEAENALFATGVLERLHSDGRLGGLWSCWSDAHPAIAARPPFDREPAASTCGVVRADGSERPVATALAAFARRGLHVASANEMTAIAAAYYYRTLPSSTKTLYEAFLRFVADRRAESARTGP